VEEGPHIVKVRMGGDTEGAPLPKHRPKLRIAPGHPPHLRKKHGIGLRNAFIGFCHLKAFPDGLGWSPVIGEDGQASF